MLSLWGSCPIILWNLVVELKKYPECRGWCYASLLRGEGKERRLPKRFPESECCFSPTTCAWGGEVLALALVEFCQWLKSSQDCTLLGMMGSYVPTELVCRSRARLDNSSLNFLTCVHSYRNRSYKCSFTWKFFPLKFLKYVLFLELRL